MYDGSAPFDRISLTIERDRPSVLMLFLGDELMAVKELPAVSYGDVLNLTGIAGGFRASDKISAAERHDHRWRGVGFGFDRNRVCTRCGETKVIDDPPIPHIECGGAHVRDCDVNTVTGRIEGTCEACGQPRTEWLDLNHPEAVNILRALCRGERVDNAPLVRTTAADTSAAPAPEPRSPSQGG